MRNVRIPASPPALPEPLLQLAKAQEGALTGDQIRSMVGRATVTRLVRQGSVRRLWWDAYALPSHAEGVRTRLAAADLSLGMTAVACLDTAAQLHGFDLSDDRRLHLLAPGDAAVSRAPAVVLHRDRVLDPLVRVDGRIATSPAETAVRLAARSRGGPHGLAVLDAAVRSGAAAQNGLVEIADVLHINNIRVVRELLPWIAGLAESPGESWLRWVVHSAGLPHPTPQFRVVVDGCAYRLDLAWPERRVACEYDGVAWHTGENLFRDRERMNALRRAGWVVVFVTASMIFNGRGRLIEHLAELLR